MFDSNNYKSFLIRQRNKYNILRYIYFLFFPKKKPYNDFDSLESIEKYIMSDDFEMFPMAAENILITTKKEFVNYLNKEVKNDYHYFRIERFLTNDSYYLYTNKSLFNINKCLCLTDDDNQVVKNYFNFVMDSIEINYKHYLRKLKFENIFTEDYIMLKLKDKK